MALGAFGEPKLIWGGLGEARWPNMGPRWSQDGAMMVQDGAKMGQDGAKMGQDRVGHLAHRFPSYSVTSLGWAGV